MYLDNLTKRDKFGPTMMMTLTTTRRSRMTFLLKTSVILCFFFSLPCFLSYCCIISFFFVSAFFVFLILHDVPFSLLGKNEKGASLRILDNKETCRHRYCCFRDWLQVHVYVYRLIKFSTNIIFAMKERMEDREPIAFP